MKKLFLISFLILCSVVSYAQTPPFANPQTVNGQFLINPADNGLWQYLGYPYGYREIVDSIYFNSHLPNLSQYIARSDSAHYVTPWYLSENYLSATADQNLIMGNYTINFGAGYIYGSAAGVTLNIDATQRNGLNFGSSDGHTIMQLNSNPSGADDNGLNLFYPLHLDASPGSPNGGFHVLVREDFNGASDNIGTVKQISLDSLFSTISGDYQPLEDQRLSTTNSPTFAGIFQGLSTFVRTFYAMGTSLTLATNGASLIRSADSSIMQYVFRNFGANIVNRGSSGRTTQQLTAGDSSLYSVRNSFPYYSSLGNGGILYLEGMVNDAVKDTTLLTPALYQQQLDSCVYTAIYKRNIPAGHILLYNPSYWSTTQYSNHGNIAYRHSVYYTAMLAVANKYGTLIYDGYNDFKPYYQANNSLLVSDSLHMSAAGQALAGRFLVNYLSAHLPVYNYTASLNTSYASASAAGNFNVGNDLNVAAQTNTNYFQVYNQAFFDGTANFYSPVNFQTSGNNLWGADAGATTVTANVQKKGNWNIFPYGSTTSFTALAYAGNSGGVNMYIGGLSTSTTAINQLDFYLTSTVGGLGADIARLTGSGFTSYKTLTRSGSFSAAAPGTAGSLLNMAATTFTDTTTAASATVGSTYGYYFGIPTLAAKNTGVIYTTANTLTIAGAPAAGANVSITNPFALNILAGTVRLGGYPTPGGLFYGGANNVLTESAALSGILKGNGSGAPTVAVFGTDLPGLASTNLFSGANTFNGKFNFSTAANGPSGSATLASGTVTVANTSVTANSIIVLVSATAGEQAKLSYTVSAGTSFTISSTTGTDSSVIKYFIIN